MCKYRVVGDKDLTAFTKLVDSYLGAGWKLQGGIFIRASDGMYLQAMYRVVGQASGGELNV
jgi:hypothetical protein